MDTIIGISKNNVRCFAQIPVRNISARTMSVRNRIGAKHHGFHCILSVFIIKKKSYSLKVAQILVCTGANDVLELIQTEIFRMYTNFLKSFVNSFLSQQIQIFNLHKRQS